MKKLVLILLSFLFLYSCDGDSDDRSGGCIPLPGPRCQLAPDSGPCDAHIPKYYYDMTEGKCKEFIWGGCEGVVPFNSMEECQQCEKAAHQR